MESADGKKRKILRESIITAGTRLPLGGVEFSWFFKKKR
jgi:hypothetical protein